MFLNKDLLESGGDSQLENSEIENPAEIVLQKDISQDSSIKRPQRSQNNRFQLKKSDVPSPSPSKPIRNLGSQKELVTQSPQSPKKVARNIFRNPSFLDDETDAQQHIQDIKNIQFQAIINDDDDGLQQEDQTQQLQQQQIIQNTLQQRKKIVAQQRFSLQEKQQFTTQAIPLTPIPTLQTTDHDYDFAKLAKIVSYNNDQHEPGQFKYEDDSLPQLQSHNSKYSIQECQSPVRQIHFNTSQVQISELPMIEEQQDTHYIEPIQESFSEDSENNEENCDELLRKQLELRKEIKFPSEKVLIEFEGVEVEEDPPSIEQSLSIVQEESQQAQTSKIAQIAYPKPFEDVDTSNMRNFLTNPAPQGGMIQCTLKRDKSGMNRFSPKYILHLSNGCKFLMSAKKQSYNNNSNYIISMDFNVQSNKNTAYLGKVSSNFIGTESNLYDKGQKPKQAICQAETRKQIGVVLYESNIMGSKGPRKMRVLIPKVNDQSKPDMDIRQNTLQSDYKRKNTQNIMVFINRPPKWNEKLQAFVLNFYGRVEKASVKNFQLVEEDGEDQILLQFGRMGEDLFNLDFQYPINPLQAFQIALSSFDYKLGCE